MCLKRHLSDEDWRFHLGDPAASRPDLDDSNWRRLDLPHDWSVELDRSPDCPSGDQGGFFVDGVGWYRKHFSAPDDWRERKVSVEFEGVYRNAEVWLNGHELGVHPYGYTTFHFDLTPYLRFGDKANVLAVRVDNSTHRHTRWYSGSGIYRHVWLIATHPVHVAQWGLSVTTPVVSEQEATVRVVTTVCNDSGTDQDIAVRCRVTGDGGIEIHADAETNVRAGTDAELVADVVVPSPVLWSPESPSLYRLVAEVSVEGEVLDTETTAFGIRSFYFNTEEGFVLNDRRTILRGGCVHHDCGPLGAASIDRAEERKVEVLKASGFNAIRCAHNPPSPAFLEACDRLGMLVIDEAFDVWREGKIPYDYHRHFDDWWQRDLDSMLLRDRNHPSIILWSIGNELCERGLPEGAALAKTLSARVRKIDPTRPITAGINSVPEWRDTDGLFDYLDVCGYNYRLEAYEPDHELHPDRVIIATESFPPQSYEYWKAVEKLPYVAGDFVWTSHDYLGEAGIGHTRSEDKEQNFALGYPWNQANCGDIDLCGWKRPQSHYRDVLWNRAAEPYIAVHPPNPSGKEIVVSHWGWHDVQPSWTWPGCDGEELRVDVYYACDEIELFLNGKSLGKRPATAESVHIATFRVSYEAGELEAVAYADGIETGRSALSTAGPAERIRLCADRVSISSDPRDLAYVTVEVVDASDKTCPNAANMVFFTVTGPGRIAAVASADPRNTETYRGNSHSVWRGKCLVVVQPTGEPGEIRLLAHADHLEGGSLDVEAAR